MPNPDSKSDSKATISPETWGLKESADWWSAGQVRRQAIYGPATERMLDLADVRPGSRVLDVAAGTGESTMMAARRVGPTGYVLGVDQSASMLNVAAETARKERITNIETRVMNAETLTLDSDSFNAVISRIALMLFPNPAKALTEMRRVTKPGGKVAVMVYSALDKNPYHGIFYDTVSRIGSIPLPARGQPWMYALADPAILEGIYRDAGFQNVSIETFPIPRRFPSATEAVANMRKSVAVGRDLKEFINLLKEADRETALAKIEQEFKRFEGSNGLELPGEVLIGVGT